MYAVRNVPVY